MLAIILSACLASDPGVCKEYRIPLDADIDMTRCAMYAPPHFAQWSEEHPGWVIRKWQCSPKSASNI